MNTQGFVKLPRAILAQAWYRNNNARLLFIHLLLTANFTDDATARRGEVATSYPLLAGAVGLSIQQLRTALSVLVEAGMITRETTRRSTAVRTVVTICHFDCYQGQATVCQHDRQHDDQRQAKETKESNQRKKRKQEELLEEGRSAMRSEPEKKDSAPALVLTPPTAKAKAKKGFVPPTVEEVARYVAEHQLLVDAGRFVDYYARRGWRTQGRWKLIDWRAKLGDWDSRERAAGNVPVVAPTAAPGAVIASAPAVSEAPELAAPATINASTSINTHTLYTNELYQSTSRGGYPHTTFTKEQANQYAIDMLRAMQQRHEARRREQREQREGCAVNG